MQIKKLFLVSIILAVAGFGLYGLKELVNSKIDPVQASAPAGDKPGALTLVNASTAPDGQPVSAIEILPAPEIPTRAPDAGGVFNNREGNTLTMQSFTIVTTSTQGTIVSGSAMTGKNPEGAPQAGELIVSGSADSIPGASQGGMSQLESGSGIIELHSGTILGQGELVPVPAGPGGASSSVTIAAGQPAEATSQNVVVTDATKYYHDVTPLPQQPPTGTQSIQQKLEAGSLDELTAQQTMMTVWGHKDGEDLIADVIVYQTPMIIQ